jgi:feruloyl-CoA synthase
MSVTQSTVRHASVRTSGARLEQRDDGTMFANAQEALEPYPRCWTERLAHWAATAPDRVFLAERDANGAWREFTFQQTWETIQPLAQAILDRDLSRERPLAILSENSIEHALLMLAGMHVNVPTVSISPAYSLVSTDFSKLRQVLRMLTPGVVFASETSRYGRALQICDEAGSELLLLSAPSQNLYQRCSLFSEWLRTGVTAAVAKRHEEILPDDIAKFLMTSGTAGLPKAVINTHRMLCSNQQMILQVFPFFGEEPPVMLDWLPWNHTYGGNHNIGIALYNGGTLYIDDGKPTPRDIHLTVRNLREISPTVFMNVPRGFEELLPYLRSEPALRENLFRRVKVLFYAAAGMGQHLWDAYRELAEQTCGERILMVTGLGATETSPMSTACTWESDRAGEIGFPVPGVEAKLVPAGSKLELRVRGPHVTPGYWRAPELTQAAFDDEGFYRMGDAVRFLEPGNINRGLVFDGRINEDFKLDTGTWVSAGPLRAQLVAALSPYVSDAVITGLNCSCVGALLFPNVPVLRSLVGDEPVTDVPTLLEHPKVRDKIAASLQLLADRSTGSANRVARVLLLETPPSLDAGEITDKGSLNQRTIWECRSTSVEELHAQPDSPRVITVRCTESQPSRFAASSSASHSSEKGPAMLINRRTLQIQWGDCDPAGIVYYPRYFAIFDDSTAALFDKAGLNKRSFQKEYGILGIPMVDTRAQFFVPSSFGDEIEIVTTIASFGRSSFKVVHKVYKGEQLAIEATETRVWVARKENEEFGIQGKPIPDDVKSRFLTDGIEQVPGSARA